MDDPPPPVPPKDTPVKPSMDADRATPAPPSSSKRKREEASDEHVYDRRSSHLEAPDFTGHSPKRSRPSLQPSDNDASDATPVQRNVRRKKGVNNLSNLNLRHAAERQARQHAEGQPVPRESKFQEGSLTDKPSAQPPTAFTRFTRTDSGNIHLVDELMNDYHNGMASPHRSVEIDDEQHKAQTAQPASAIRSQAASTDENNSFFFRFGRSLAASFHPVRMWKQVWEETTEELRQKNLLELERKRALKEEAERRYAQMKASGQLEPRVLSRASAAGSDVTIRDSGLIFASGTPNFGHRRDMSDGSQLVPPSIDISTASESESREVVPKASKTFRSRLSFKRPSLQNLQFGIKRTKSEFNIAAAANAQRDSSSSMSPVKADMGDSALKKSQSKVDLRKQYKLSKRVSNLETKLQLARRELDEALVQASPMPKLGNKYERFTPNSTLTRSTFVPGRLESLPSERLLDPSQFNFELDGSNQGMDDHVEASHATEDASNEQAKADDLMDAGDEDDEETMRISRARPFPPRASSLFNLRNKNIEDAGKDTVDHIEPAQNDTEYDNMNTNDDADGNNETRKGSKKAASYATLDAKLKALDANVNMANRRPSHRRKRKSGEDQKDYRPEDDDEDDEDDEWGRIGGKYKRRKSAGTTKKKAARKSGTFGDEHVTHSNDQEAENNDAEATQPTDASNVHTSARKSLDSQHAALEPVAEEEADEAAFANRDPTKKPADSPQQASSDDLKARAAAVAQKHRSHSPSGPEKAASHQAIDGSHEQATAGGAKSAKSTRGRPKKGKAKVDESFEWPEDVF